MSTCFFTARRKASFASAVYATNGISVCLSVTLRYYVKTRKCRGMRFSSSGSPVSLVFWRQEWLMEDDHVQVKFDCKKGWITAESSIHVNRKSIQRAISQGRALLLTSPKCGWDTKICRFCRNFDQKALNVCYKVLLTKNFHSRKIRV